MPYKYRYKKVKRVITVEFVQVVSGNGYDIRITPETVVVRCGDTLEWSVQGLPPGLAKKVGVGNFRRLDPPWRVTHGGRGFGVPRAKAINTKRIKSRFALNRATVTFELGNLEPGNYKYDLLGDGQTVVDPELEIRGPRA